MTTFTKINPKLTPMLVSRQEEFLERWVKAAHAADIQYSGIISEDILTEGPKVYTQLAGILGRPSYSLSPRKRINPIGRAIGERRAMSGVAIEAVLEVFIIFRHELWEILGELLEDKGDASILEVRRRVDLYLDQLIASVAYAYTATKEKAMVGLIEKLLS